jgi:hypothetical protein
MLPFDRSSLYPSGTQYCCFDEAFLLAAGAMAGILNFGFTAGKRPSLEKAVWLDLPIAANIPKVGSGEIKDCKKNALGG